jgi:MFS transporter, DHA2 family, multidrug resistance protein
METHTSLATDVSSRDRWLITALLGLGLITFAIDASNTRLVLPQMMTSLRVELYQSHWVFTAPGIARTVMTASTGWLSGGLGPRLLFLLSMGSLTLGALGSLVAWDWPSLLVFRVLAGMGGGMIPPLSQAIFYQIFPPGKRGMALGFALMGWSIGPAFGPLMGVTLLETAPWRIVYAVTLPLSGMGLLLAWWWLPPLRRPARRRLDVLGVALLAVAVSTLLVALTQGNRDGWDAPHILTLLAIAGVTAVAFVVVQLARAEPLVELRLFGSVPFVMAMIVMFLTTMAFRGSEPMLSVFMQRLLGWEPVLVAWVQMLPNLVYGAMVILVGRLADRVPCYVLVMSGLTLYAGAFWGYAGINELTTVPLILVFLILRSTAEAAIGSPNNLATLEALPESKVYMATALTGLLRSVANAMGTATAAVVWDVRYSHRVQQYAETTPLDALGYTTAFHGVQQTLQWAGELAAAIPTQTLALMQERLVAEASTAAWQDYFLFNTGLALVGLLPALPCWRRQKYAPAVVPPPTPRAATSQGAPVSQATPSMHSARTP